MLYIRQNATHKVVLGPAVAVGDGFTPVTTLALSTADEAEVILHDNATVVDISGYTWAAITTADGYYHLTLQTGISGTIGHMTVVVNDDSLCLPLRADFTILEEAVYDDIFASSADPFTVMQSDVAAIEIKTSDTHSRLVVVEAAIDSDQTSRATAISDVKSQLTLVDSAIDSDQTSRTAAISDVKSQLTIVASDSAVIESDTTRIELALVTATGALEATPSSTVLQTDLAEATNNHYNNMVFVMTSGDEAGEARRILSYTGATGTITLSTALSGAPTAAETFAILNIPVLGEPSEFASVVSDTLAIEAKASDTHSRLVVVESSIDSDQTSRATAISDVKSQLTIVASDTLAIEAKASDTHSRLVVVESAIDSDQTSRTTAISDVKSQLVIVASDTLAIEAKASDTHSRLVVVETAIDSDQTSRATAISDVKSALTIAASDAARIELALVAATGALESTPSSTVLQTDLPEATDNHYNNMVFVMTSGDEAGEARRILSYTGATGTVTLSTALSGSPTAAETFAILNIPVLGEPSEFASVVSDTLAIEAKASDTHSRLVVVESSIDSDQTSRTAAISDVKSQLVIVASDTLAIEAKASDTHSRLVVVETAIDSDQTSRTAAISDVKSALTIAASDAALLEAAHSEPTGVPAANESPLDKLAYLFMVMRNKKTVTSTKKTIFGDDDVGEWEHDLSDDGTTTTETEANVI